MSSDSEFYINDPDSIYHKYDDLGNYLEPKKVLDAAVSTNKKMQVLIQVVNKNVGIDFLNTIDKKQTGQLIGSIFVIEMEKIFDELARTPSPTGHPDLIPSIYVDNLKKDKTINYDQFDKGGVEVKTSIGSLKTNASSKLKVGESRIEHLTSIEWKGHHTKINNLLGLFWDYNKKNKIPTIIAGLYSNQLIESDFSYTDQTVGGGNTTNVAITKKSAKIKMGRGWVFCNKETEYVKFVKKVFKIDSFN